MKLAKSELVKEFRENHKNHLKWQEAPHNYRLARNDNKNNCSKTTVKKLYATYQIHFSVTPSTFVLNKKFITLTAIPT